MIKSPLVGAKNLTKNTFWSTIYKVVSIVVNLLLVRVCTNYFGEERYGIWLTVLSFFTWFSVLEVGISNSFRNKLTTYFTRQDFKEGNRIVSKGYKSLAITYLSLSVLLIILSYWFNIDAFFTPSNSVYDDFGFAFRISTVFYMLYFISYFLNTILLATHHARTTYLITAIQGSVTLMGIYLFQYLDLMPSFTLIFSWFTFVPLVTWIMASRQSYKNNLKTLSPNLREVFQKKVTPFKDINKDFFIIQLCTLIIFSTDNLIIVNSLSGAEVLKYNVAFKYFNILIVGFNLILIPYWSSFTEAASLKNREWIVKHIRKLIIIWLLIFFCALLLLAFSDWAYEIWIGKKIEIPLILSIFTGISVLLTAWNNIFAYFLNAISKVKLQMQVLVFSALINIPFSLYLLSFFEAAGVIIATCLSLIPLAIILPIQYMSIIKKITSNDDTEV